MLVDSVTITLKAGNGGNGAATFRRDAMTAYGGPDGGDGGHGGSIFAQGTTNVTDLREFRYKKTIKGHDGRPGTRHNGFGRKGEHITIYLPFGTTITDVSSGQKIEIIDETPVCLAKGGTGGRGNVAFKSAVNRIPRQYEYGTPGEEKTVHLELKLIADIGLIGLPNAGKSSLLRALTNATPRIGAYPFTTLEPNIGMLGRHALADIPGLIEGASSGKGLGMKFLKHIEKTKILIHCIDATEKELFHNYGTVRKEFEEFDPALLEKPELIFLNKIDLLSPLEIQNAENVFTSKGKHVITGSTRSSETLVVLKDAMEKLLKTIM